MIFTVTISANQHEAPRAAIPVVAENAIDAMQEVGRLVNAVTAIFSEECRRKGIAVPEGMQFQVSLSPLPTTIPYRPGLAECELGGPRG